MALVVRRSLHDLAADSGLEIRIGPLGHGRWRVDVYSYNVKGGS